MKKLRLSGDDFEILSSEILEQGTLLRFRANGNSMRPFIRNNDILIVKPRNESSVIKNGDIIFYKNKNNNIIAHRVIKTGKALDTFWVRGDGYIGGKEKVKLKNISGIVYRIERNNREINIYNPIYKIAIFFWTRFQNIRWFLFRVRRKIENSYL